VGDFLSSSKPADDEDTRVTSEVYQELVNFPDCLRLPLCPHQLIVRTEHEAAINLMLMASAWRCLPNPLRAPIAGWH